MALCAIYWAVAMVLVSRLPIIERLGITSTTHVVLATVRQLGQHAVRVANAIEVNGSNVTVASDCSPHIAYLVFASVLLAFPSNAREKLLGLTVGLLVIFAFNIVRIVALIEVLIFRPSLFEFAHVYLWQTGTILMMLGTFGLWLRWLNRAHDGPRPHRSSSK